MLARRRGDAARARARPRLAGFLPPLPFLRFARHQEEVLSQGVPFERLRKEELHEVRMLFESDPEELPRLSLVPVGAAPDAAECRHGAAVARDADLHVDVVLAAHGIRMRDD